MGALPLMYAHPVTRQIIDMLLTQGCWYEIFTHEPVTTSEEAARVRPEYTLEQGAKALIVKVEHKDGRYGLVMLVLPAHLKLNSKKVRSALHIRGFRFATEDEVKTQTKGVERGGVPPFGDLFDMPVYVDKTLLSNEKIIFNAGDRSVSVAMLCADYVRIVEPQLVDIHA